MESENQDHETSGGIGTFVGLRPELSDTAYFTLAPD